MGNVKIDKSTQVFLVIGMIAMLAFAAFAAFKPVTVNVAEADVDEEAIAQLVLGGIVLPSENATLTSDKLDAIYNDIFRDDNAEDVAEMLALDELDTKDFKRALVKFLVNKTIIEDIDYRDIEDISVRDVDVSIDDEDANVTVEFKVYVSNFGDSDEEEKARVSVVFTVEDLDEDDDYEDAEAYFDGEFDLIKFYD